MKKIIIFPFLLVSLMLISLVSATTSYYDFKGYTSSLDLTEYGITFNYSGTCLVQMASKNNFTTYSGTFDSDLSWRSPDSITLGIASTLEDISNTSCLSYGRTALKDNGKDSTSGYYESSWVVTHSADNGFVSTETRYVCPVDGSIIDFTIPNASDSRGYCPYGMRTATDNSRISFLDALVTNYEYCNDITAWSASGSCTYTHGETCTDCQKTTQYIYPFNSSATGAVTYNITENLISVSSGAQTIYVTFTVDLVNTEAETRTALYAKSITTGATYDFLDSGSLSLTPDTEYLLVMTFNTTKVGGVDYAFTSYGPTIDFTIFTFRPDYVCGPWSACEDKSKYRICVDSFGVADDLIETAICEPTIIENATLGFEETESVTATICFPDWNVITAQWGLVTGHACVYMPHNITVERPVNWTVSGDGLTFNRYFMDFTSEWASEGTRSLKLWTIPPKEHEWDGSTCTNRTVSEFPVIENIFSNASMRVNFNVTFPATNMRIRFDAKTCEEQVRQNYPLNAFNATWIQVQVCPEYCYASDCNTTPKGNFYFDLYDNSINASVFGEPIYHESITTKRQPIDIDLTGVSLEPGKNYTLSFAIFTNNPQDTRGNCIMLDDVRYDVLEESYLTILDGECKSKCVGNDYYQARVLPNGGCLLKKIYFSEICMTEEISASVENLEDVCLDSNTLLHYNTFLADYEELDCDYGCKEGHCLTSEEEAEEEAEEELYTDYVGQSVLGYDLGDPLNSFLSVFMVVNYVIIIIMSAVVYFTNVWQIGAVTGLMLILGVTVIGFYPFWVGLAIILGIGALLAYKLSDVAR